MKAFVIYLPSRDHSVTHANEMLDTLTSYGIDTELFVGTDGTNAVKMAEKANKTLYPYSIKNRILEEDDIERLIRPELYEEFKNKHYKAPIHNLFVENSFPFINTKLGFNLQIQ